MNGRAVALLVASVVGLLTLPFVFWLLMEPLLGTVPVAVGNGILLADLVGVLLGFVAGVLAWRGSPLMAYVGIGSGGLGLAAAAVALLASWPWEQVIAVRNVLLLHVWAAFIVAVAVWPHPHGASPGVSSG